MTTLQQANAEYIEHDAGPASDWRDLAKQEQSDADVILRRFFILGNRAGLTLEDLTTCWRPFLQTGPRERKFWSAARVKKTLDALVASGAVEVKPGITGRCYQLTDAMREAVRLYGSALC